MGLASQRTELPTAQKRTCLDIQSDVLLALDRNEVVFMVLRVFLSALDTVDHALLLETLIDHALQLETVETRFGVNGQALSWLRSYLTDRFHTVRIGGSIL